MTNHKILYAIIIVYRAFFDCLTSYCLLFPLFVRMGLHTADQHLECQEVWTRPLVKLYF